MDYTYITRRLAMNRKPHVGIPMEASDLTLTQVSRSQQPLDNSVRIRYINYNEVSKARGPLVLSGVVSI